MPIRILVLTDGLSRTIHAAILKRERSVYDSSFMEHIEVISRSLRSMAWMFALQGILAIVFGLLILAYPPLLAMLVGIILVIAGILGIIAAVVVGKFSKIKLEA